MANEKRLIDANALKNHVQAVSTHWLNDWSTIGVLAAVDKQPTVDAVEVVRCKDCIYNEKSSCMFSQFANPHYRPDYFCADGERREGE